MRATKAARSGRHRRLAQSSAKPALAPYPPRQFDGTYKPLITGECEQIFDTALRLLETLGMGEVPDRLRTSLLIAGAKERHDDRVTFPSNLVTNAIELAAKTFTLHGRDPERSIEVGGNRVYFGTGGAAVQTLDLTSSTYRPSTLQDLRDFTRLQDTLANVSWFTRCCVATDIPNSYDLDVNTAYYYSCAFPEVVIHGLDFHRDGV